MDRPYPPLQQLEKQFCFLSPKEEHDRLLIDLHNEVVMVPFAPAYQPTKEELTSLLVARYGGSNPNWKLQSTRLGFLVHSPDWLLPDQILYDSFLWERDFGLQVLPWNCLDSSFTLPPRRRVLVMIKNFPVDYWHPCYFRQATSSWGTMAGIAPENLSGEDKTVLKMLMDVHDNKLVPFKLFVGHQNRWTECEVEMDGRRAPRPVSDTPPPPPNLGGDHFSDTDEDDSPPRQEPPYIPPWRRLDLQGLIPPPDPARRVAPAASLEPTNSNSCARMSGPGLCVPFPVRDYAPSPGESRSQGEPRGCRKVFNPQVPSPRIRQSGGTCHETIRGPVSLESWEGTRACHTHRNDSRIKTTLLRTRVPSRGGYGECGLTKSQADRNDLRYRTVSATSQSSILGIAPNHVTHTSSYFTRLATLNPDCFQPNKYGSPNPHYPALPSNLFSSLSPFHYNCTTSKFSLSHHPRLPLCTMTEMREEDEALIRQFVGLHTGDELVPAVKIPQRATTSTSWELCLLVRVVTDRVTPDQAFSMLMIRVWGVDPGTVIRPVARNCYLVEFVNAEERLKVSVGGPWTFRGDLLATRHVTCHSDLKPEHIGFGHIWVQFFGLPVNCLTEEGIHLIGEKVGIPVTPSVEGFVSGKRFLKLKILVNLEEGLKDKVKVDHPFLGELTSLCVYEKVSRICRFCGKLGHELHGCPTYARVAALMQQEEYRERYDPNVVLSPKKGPWICNSSLLPRVQPAYLAQDDVGPATNKRPFNSTGLESQNQSAHGPSEGARSPNVTLPISAAVGPVLVSSSSHSVKRPRPAGPNPPAMDI